MEETFELSSPEATFELGERLGGLLGPGDFVGLSGDLGAGKTLLVRGAARAIGCARAQVQSPTFTIVNSYAGGRLPVHHVDLYRIEGEDELYATGYFDLLEGDGALLVEWPERVARASPPARLELHFERLSETGRKLWIVARGERHEAILAALVRGRAA